MPKVSVIVPIYNSEKYLSECLGSILAQSIKDIEVLMVDDGSTDRSAEICHEFSDNYPQFHYIKKVNGGTASARNVGLAHATGEYIGFVDSDDWIEPDMFEKMYQEAVKCHGADIVYCPMDGLSDYVMLQSGCYNAERINTDILPRILPHVVQSGTFRTVDWGNCSRIFKRATIANIKFFEGSRRCEDFAFAVECTLYAQKYVVMEPITLYHYRPNENSKSRAYTKHMWTSIRALMIYMQAMLHECKRFDFHAAMNYCVFYFAVLVIRNETKVLAKQERIEKMKEIVTDTICQVAVLEMAELKMNNEYSQYLDLIRSQDWIRVEKYSRNIKWRKEKIVPITDRIFSNKFIRRLYGAIRRK